MIYYQEANTCAQDGAQAFPGAGIGGHGGIALKMSESDREETTRTEEVFACFDGELVHETPAYTHPPPPTHTHIHK